MKHFSIAELSRTSCSGIDIIANLTALVEKVLDPAREAFDAAVRVSSGYQGKKELSPT